MSKKQNCLLFFTVYRQNIIEIGNINVIKHLVENNNGITSLYEIAVKDELEKGTLKKIEIDDLQKNHDFYFIWRKNSAFKVYIEN